MKGTAGRRWSSGGDGEPPAAAPSSASLRVLGGHGGAGGGKRVTPWGCKEGREQGQRGAWGARAAPRSGGGPVVQRIVTGPADVGPIKCLQAVSALKSVTRSALGGEWFHSLRSGNRFIKYIADTDGLRDEI